MAKIPAGYRKSQISKALKETGHWPREARKRPRQLAMRAALQAGGQPSLAESIEQQLMEQMEAQRWRRRGGKPANVSPGCGHDPCIRQSWNGRCQFEQRGGPGSVDPHLLREQISATPLAFYLAVAGAFLMLAVARPMMLATIGCRTDSIAVPAQMRMVPAASKRGVDEEHRGAKNGQNRSHQIGLPKFRRTTLGTSRDKGYRRIIPSIRRPVKRD